MTPLEQICVKLKALESDYIALQDCYHILIHEFETLKDTYEALSARHRDNPVAQDNLVGSN